MHEFKVGTCPYCGEPFEGSRDTKAHWTCEAANVPTPTPDTVEAVARAAYGGDFTTLGPDSQRYWREMAERAIAAYEARRK